MSVLDSFLNILGKGDSIKDYRHASQLFVSSNYRLAPKYSWLYHVFFDKNATRDQASTGGQDVNEMTEVGMLVNSVQLPSFAVDQSTLNTYNRPQLVQTKLRYQPVQITFHDDSADIVRTMWEEYYRAQYYDPETGFAGSNIHADYFGNYKYTTKFFDKFGYIPENANVPNYFDSIRIYSLHQKRFSEYILINPMITSFSHGGHATASRDTNQMTMTVAYTTVLYNEGNVTVDSVKGFADLHYDKSPSPLSIFGGGTGSILGPGGLVAGAADVANAANSGNFAAAAFAAARTIGNARNMDTSAAASAELKSIASDVLRQSSADPNSPINLPTVGILDSASAVATVGVGVAVSSGVTSNGENINTATPPPSSPDVSELNNAPTVLADNTLVTTELNEAGEITGAPIDKVVNFVKGSLNASSETTLSQFTGFKGSLLQISKNLSEKADISLERQARSQSTTIRPISTAAIKPTGPTYVKGTNTIVTRTSAPLELTPYANKVIPKVVDLASSEADKFLVDGNKQELSTSRVPTSTNPAP